MRFDEMGLKDSKTLMLLPGTACDYQANFGTVLDRLGKKYHLICVNYDGFDGSATIFPDIAMQKLHASLIREGTCVESPCCDYCIVGDRHPLAQGYELVRKENGLLVSVKKQAREIMEGNRI